MLLEQIHERPRIRTTYRRILCDPALAPVEYASIRSLMIGPKPTSQERRVRRQNRLRELLDRYHAKACLEVQEDHNLAPLAGRSVLAQRLAGVTTYTGIITKLAVGTGATTPTEGDTALTTELYRQDVSDGMFVNNVAYLACFIAQGDGTGTLSEAGLFIDGSEMISHVLLSPPQVKGALNSLSFEITIEIL